MERDMASGGGVEAETAVIDLVSSEDDEGSGHDAGESSDDVIVLERWIGLGDLGPISMRFVIFLAPISTCVILGKN